MPFPRLLSPSPEPLPGDIFIELVQLMYTALIPAVIMGAASGAVGLLLASMTHDWRLVVLAAALVLICAVRVVNILAYRRSLKQGPLTQERAKVWERRYGGCSLLFAAALGLTSACALSHVDPTVHMLITGLVFGYGSGVVTRLAVRPRICMISLLFAAAPTVVFMALAAAPSARAHHSAAYAVQALLLASFALGSLETIMHSYRTTVRQLRTKRSLASLARKDALTGLPNRILLRETFDKAASVVRRGGGQIALLFLDLDRFKAVNDNLGHPAGDALLQAVAARLTGMLRAGDTAARLGGDEFVLVQTSMRHPDEASMLAHRVIRTLSAPYEINGETIRIGVSIGIALAPQDGLDLDLLASRADAALYAAKRTGRGGVSMWGALEDRAEAAA